MKLKRHKQIVTPDIILASRCHCNLFVTWRI